MRGRDASDADGKQRVWTPAEIRKAVALVAGVATGAVGLYLVFATVVDGGVIDLGGAVLQGQIDRGTTGLLVTFIGLLLVIWSARGIDEYRR